MGGVIMFFDRAMCVFRDPTVHQQNGSYQTGWPWAMYEAALL